MNRRKAIVLIGGIQACLLMIAIVLFVNHAISTATFTALAVAVGFITSAVVLVVIRKLPPV